MIGGRCKVCGCTDMNCSNCVEKTGMPCWWINDSQDLCSACAEENSEDEEKMSDKQEEKEYSITLYSEEIQQLKKILNVNLPW